MKIFDELINLICSVRNDMKINVWTDNKKKFIPKIYYIGLGKTGSSSIKHGFSQVNTAHWHDVGYFELIYGTNLLSSNNYDLYDFILYIGNKYNFKPIIIECIRNIIDLELSTIFQHIKKDRKHGNDCQICALKKITHSSLATEKIKEIMIDAFYQEKEPYSVKMYKKHFNIDLLSDFDIEKNYFFYDNNSCMLLFLKFENIDIWSEIINSILPYKFKLTHSNKTTNIMYNKVKKKLKFTNKELKVLENKISTTFYDNYEIEAIKKKFLVIS